MFNLKAQRVVHIFIGSVSLLLAVVMVIAGMRESGPEKWFAFALSVLGSIGAFLLILRRRKPGIPQSDDYRWRPVGDYPSIPIEQRGRTEIEIQKPRAEQKDK
jgi:hypothetical protein